MKYLCGAIDVNAEAEKLIESHKLEARGKGATLQKRVKTNELEELFREKGIVPKESNGVVRFHKLVKINRRYCFVSAVIDELGNAECPVTYSTTEAAFTFGNIDDVGLLFEDVIGERIDW